MVARLGGWNCYYRPPGPKTMADGWKRLAERLAAFFEDVLVPSAAAYDRICRAGEATTRKTRKIDGALVSLLRCTHGAWKAPALLAVRELGKSPRQLEPFLADFERLVCVLMINGTDPNHIQERYLAVIRSLKKKAFSGPSLQIGAKDLDLARRNLQGPRFALRDRFRMPVLLKLNDLLAKEAQPIDPRHVSCEHILPVNPPRRGLWRSTFRGADGRFNGGVMLWLADAVAIARQKQRAHAGERRPCGREIGREIDAAFQQHRRLILLHIVHHQPDLAGAEVKLVCGRIDRRRGPLSLRQRASE